MTHRPIFTSAILMACCAYSSAVAQTGSSQSAELARDLGRAAAKVEHAARAYAPETPEHGELQYWALAFRMLEQDPAKADNGTGKGFYRLGEFFENGLDSLKPDLREAIHWYRKAATQHNHLHAQLTLGLIYLAEVKRGVTGSASNYAEAARWLRKAADQGHPEAQVLLAVMHLEGLGVRESESEAEAWLEKANQDGLAVSKDALRERLQITPFRDWDFAQWRVWR